MPTPTTPEGFDDSVVRNVLSLAGKSKIAVIKSTIIPGTTEKLQKEFPHLYLMHSPEFLREKTATKDAANPERNIIGVTEQSKEKGDDVMAVLPRAPYEKVLPVRDAELIKYGGNIFLYFKVIFANLLYDLAQKTGADYDAVKDAVSADPRIGSGHLNPIDASGHADMPGRGAGGHCFIKDFEAFLRAYREHVGDPHGVALLESLRDKNIELLTQTGKDLDLLEEVYGKNRVGKEAPQGSHVATRL